MTPTPITSRPILSQASAPQFGRLSAGLRRADALLKVVQKNRTQEMIIEDIVGYGVLRSGMDYIRPWVYQWGGINSENKPKGNFAAARERFIRELGSIATDCFAPGLIGLGVAKYAAQQSKNPLSAQMICDDTLRLFLQLSLKAPTQKDFLENMATELAKTSPKNTAKIRTLLQQSTRQPASKLSETAIQLAQSLGQEQLDVKLKGHWFNLQTLLGDTRHFLDSLPSKQRFSQRAQQALGKALKASPWKIGAAIGGGLALTFSVPYINLMLTRHLDGLASYPAELGLRKPVTSEEQNNGKSNFSYVARQLKNGHYWPLIMSILPLTVVAGMVDTVKLSNGQFKQAFSNPFKKGLKGFMEHQIRLNQFSKSFPFTSQQQIAALYGALITSRLVFSRSDIEFRERLVDSVFLGWMIWILGTPFTKRALAQYVDHTKGTKLMKKVGGASVLKSQLEVERLMPKLSKLRIKTLSSLIKINAGSIAATLLILGIVEPLVAMKWSMIQAKSRAGH